MRCSAPRKLDIMFQQKLAWAMLLSLTICSVSFAQHQETGADDAEKTNLLLDVVCDRFELTDEENKFILFPGNLDGMRSLSQELFGISLGRTPNDTISELVPRKLFLKKQGLTLIDLPNFIAADDKRAPGHDMIASFIYSEIIDAARILEIMFLLPSDSEDAAWIFEDQLDNMIHFFGYNSELLVNSSIVFVPIYNLNETDKAIQTARNMFTEKISLLNSSLQQYIDETKYQKLYIETKLKLLLYRSILNRDAFFKFVISRHIDKISQMYKNGIDANLLDQMLHSLDLIEPRNPDVERIVFAESTINLTLHNYDIFVNETRVNLSINQMYKTIMDDHFVKEFQRKNSSRAVLEFVSQYACILNRMDTTDFESLFPSSLEKLKCDLRKLAFAKKVLAHKSLPINSYKLKSLRHIIISKYDHPCTDSL